VIEHVIHMCKALCSIASTKKKEKSSRVPEILKPT
jgi:hypothetical protein